MSDVKSEPPRLCQLRKNEMPPLTYVRGSATEASALAIWHSFEVWLAQCLCESNESLPNRRLVESAKAEEQCLRIRTSQRASIDGKNLNTLGRRQLFRLVVKSFHS